MGYISRSADIYHANSRCWRRPYFKHWFFICCPSEDKEEQEGEQREETIPKQGKAASVAEALADTQAELEEQSAIPSAGKESGKESADSAKPQSKGALNEVIKRRSEDPQSLKDESADLKRSFEELEEKHKSLPVRKSTIFKCHFK